MQNFLLILLFLIGLSADNLNKNELENTTWKGTFNIPDATEGLFVFKQDTVRVMINDYPLETMKFSTKGDTLILRKISGDSSCGMDDAFYQYTITDAVLKLKMLEDDCPDRSSGIGTEGFVKQ